MIHKDKAMNRSTGWIKAAVICLTVVALAVLAFAFTATQTHASGGPAFKSGTIAAKGLVLGDNGKPIWAEFDAEGNVVRQIGEAVGELENAFVMPAGTYRAYGATFQAVEQEHSAHRRILYRDDYLTTAFALADGSAIDPPPLADNTYSVVVRTAEVMFTASVPLVLHESPLDLLRPQSIPDTARAVLLGEDRRVLATAEVNIGYLAAYYSSQESGASLLGDNSLWGYQKGQDQLWGPIAGAKVQTSLGRQPTFSDETGFYVAPYFIPPCPGFFFEYNTNVYVELRYQQFDPQRRTPFGSWYESRPGWDYCVGFSEGVSASTLGGAVTQLSLMDIEASMVQPTHRIDFSIDVAVLTGQASMQNEPRAGVGVDPDLTGTVPLGSTTRYAFNQPDFSTSRPFFLDLDEDGQQNRIKLRKNEDDSITVDVWLGDADQDAPAPPPDLDGDGQPDTVKFRINDTGQAFLDIWTGESNPDGNEADRSRHLLHLPDNESDFSDQGLVKQISKEDLENTDLYIYRISNGQQITSRKGLRPNESNPYQGGGATTQAESLVNYRMLMRGPASFNPTRTMSFEDWVSRTNINEELRSRRADHLRVGEQVKVIMINRATGYIGSAIGTFGENFGSGLISFSPEPIIMRPPNLKIQTDRDVDIECGLTAGEQREYIIGFEGSGLTSDKVIAITTEWVDWDGSPLPEDLPGYTGRLAKVVEENTLGPVSGQIANFDIKPGKHIQLVQLPQADIDNAHYYIQVSGEPLEGNPNFSNSVFDSTGAAGEGALQYRPDRYVPIQVPLYDEVTTEAIEAARQTAAVQGQPTPETTEPVYTWVYRPEMQFSVFDLDLKRIERYDKDQTPAEPIQIIPIGNDLDNLARMLEDDVTFAELFYGLDASDYEPLAPFGPDRQLVFALGDYEYAASVGLDGRLYFDDFEDINLLEGEDYLAFRLYQNSDDANLLFEYAFADLYIETTDPEFPGLALRWDDYYPALGDKRIRIKTRSNLDGQSIRGEILNTGADVGLKSAVEGNRAAVAVTQFEDKTATFYLSGLTWAPESDPNHVNNSVRVKFTLFNEDGSEANDIEGTWRVKNNANTTLDEVLAGEAVFVCDLQRNDDGSFNTDGGTYHVNVGDSHKGDTTGDSNNLRKVDFAQELLNQVVSRKRGVTYALMDEDGYFGTITEAGIHTFKEAFHVANTAEGTAFRKLMKDYGQENKLGFWEDKFVDKQLLVGGTQRTDLENGPDNLINTVAGNTVNDTGLYELYVNVVKVFVDNLMNLANSYRTNSNPSNNANQWVSRTEDVIQTTTEESQPVSYSYGGRNTITEFNDLVSKHRAPSYDDIENNQDYIEYQDYSGNIRDAQEAETNRLHIAHGVVGDGNKKWPGLYLFEWQHGQNDPLPQGQSRAGYRWYFENWTGIDCIGFVLHGLRYAERPADYATVQILSDADDMTLPGVSIGEVYVSSTETESIHANGWSGPLMLTNVSNFFDSRNTDLLYYWVRTDGDQELIHKGDFVHYNGHISIVYSNGWGSSLLDSNIYPNIDYDIVHAYGVESYHMDFSRKVIVTGNDIITMPNGFGRVKLWD